jgi:uncharacterized membrane protein YgcG
VGLARRILGSDRQAKVRRFFGAGSLLIVVMLVVLASGAWLVSVVASVDFGWALLWVAFGAALLATLIWLARITTPLRTAATMFAVLTAYLGVLGFLKELTDDTPALDPARVVTKDPNDDIRGRYIARLDGDIYIATRQQRDDRFRVTVIPKDRVTALFVGPSGQVPKPNTSDAQSKDAKKREAEQRAARCEPIYPLDTDSECTRDATGFDASGKNGSTSEGGSQTGGDESSGGGGGTTGGGSEPDRESPVPLPDNPDRAPDVEGPEVSLPAIDPISVVEDGSFLFEIPAFGEQATGVLSFVTQDEFDVPPAAGEGERRHVRVLLGTLPLEVSAKDKHVLVRLRMSGVARDLLAREKALAVIVRVVAADELGNTNVDQECFVLRAAHSRADAVCKPTD